MRNFRLYILILVLASCGFIVYDCGTMGTAVGDNDIVYVFADSADWPLYQEPLNTIFGKYVRTPIMEREYLLEWVPFEKFGAYKKSKNIFILGRLNSKDPVSEDVKSLLNKDIMEGVKTGKYFYIPKKNVWAYNQYVLFFVANSVDDMIRENWLIRISGNIILPGFAMKCLSIWNRRNWNLILRITFPSLCGCSMITSLQMKASRKTMSGSDGLTRIVLSWYTG